MVEGGGGPVGGNDLGEEDVVLCHGLEEQRLQLVGGVLAGGTGAGHHEFGLLENLVAGIVDEKGMGDRRDDGQGNGDEKDEQDVEFEQKLHEFSGVMGLGLVAVSMTSMVRSSLGSAPQQKRWREVKVAVSGSGSENSL